jgi:hypothetical protein
MGKHFLFVSCWNRGWITRNRWSECHQKLLKIGKPCQRGWATHLPKCNATCDRLPPTFVPVSAQRRANTCLFTILLLVWVFFFFADFRGLVSFLSLANDIWLLFSILELFGCFVKESVNFWNFLYIGLFGLPWMCIIVLNGVYSSLGFLGVPTYPAF